MTGIVIRIALRYLAGILIAKGFLAPEDGMQITADPDVAMALQIAAGALVGSFSEAWFWLAKRWGWKT